MPLAKSKLTLRLRSQSETAEGYAELLFENGYWSVVTSAEGLNVRVNDATIQQSRLMPDDVLTVGRHRYRISYKAPEAPQKTTPPASASVAPQTSSPPAAPPPAPVQPSVLGMLIPCAGGRPIPLRKQRVVIGRASECDVVLPLKVVSSRHCELDFISGYWQANDLGSHNGTFVDGTRYLSKWILPGSVMGISTQRFRMEYIAQGERPTRDDDVPVLSKKSLMESAGLSGKKLDSLVTAHPEEPVRPRWKIDDDL
jgi:pSer/pThr/pTyr-binding forkhead associated (FHA) protein